MSEFEIRFDIKFRAHGSSKEDNLILLSLPAASSYLRRKIARRKITENPPFDRELCRGLQTMDVHIRSVVEVQRGGALPSRKSPETSFRTF